MLRCRNSTQEMAPKLRNHLVQFIYDTCPTRFWRLLSLVRQLLFWLAGPEPVQSRDSDPWGWLCRSRTNQFYRLVYIEVRYLYERSFFKSCKIRESHRCGTLGKRIQLSFFCLFFCSFIMIWYEKLSHSTTHDIHKRSQMVVTEHTN